MISHRRRGDEHRLCDLTVALSFAQLFHHLPRLSGQERMLAVLRTGGHTVASQLPDQMMGEPRIDRLFAGKDIVNADLVFGHGDHCLFPDR